MLLIAVSFHQRFAKEASEQVSATAGSTIQALEHIPYHETTFTTVMTLQITLLLFAFAKAR